MKPTLIYRLVCPDTREVRYVGKTNQSLVKRLNNHRNQHESFPVTKWVKSLLLIGKTPIIESIEEVDPGLWREREKFWIAYYRSIGANLLNKHPGGEGLIVCSEEHRRKIGQANKGRPPSELAKRNQHAAVAKINEEIVHEIDRLINKGMTHTAIGKQFGIDQALVTKIASREKWSHVPRLVDRAVIPRPNDPKLNEELIGKINQLLKSGLSQRKAASLVGVSRPVVRKAAQRLAP